MITDIIIAVYISEEIEHANDLTILKNLGKILYETSTTAYLTRALDSGLALKILNLTYYQPLLEQSISGLEESRNLFLDYYSSGSYCASSDIANSNIIPLGTRQGINQPDYANVYDALSFFIQKGTTYIKSIKNNETYIDDEYFLVVNGLGDAYHMINSSFSGLAECEINKLKSERSTVQIISYMGLLVLAICCCILLHFAKRLNYKKEILGNFIRKSAYISYYELQHNLYNRLSTIHEILQEAEDTKISKKNKTLGAPIKSKEGYKMVYLCLIFIFLTAGYYFVVMYYLYPQCEDVLIMRLHVMKIFYLRLATISEISFWTREVTLKTYYPLSKVLYPHYNFENPDSSLMNAINRLEYISHHLSNLKYHQIFSQSIEESLFEGISNPSDIVFSYGTYTSTFALIGDTLHVSFNLASPNWSQIYLKNYERWSELQIFIKDRAEDMDHDTRMYIEVQLGYIIYITFVYSVLCVLLYWCLYMPYFFEEKKKLMRIQEISKLIPSNNVKNN